MNEAKEKKLALTVDGKNVHMNEFVREIIEGTVRGMVSSLRDVDPNGEIRLALKRKSS